MLSRMKKLQQLKQIRWVLVPDLFCVRINWLTFYQIDVAVNAPEAGTIKEFLANEEDTVTVGQDLVRLELGGSPTGGDKEKAGSEPKEPASKEQPTSSDPEPTKKQESGSKTESTLEPSSKEQKQPEPKKETPPPKQTESKSSSSGPATLGNREERRVCASHSPCDALADHSYRWRWIAWG
jgi:pyruvate/2-oxoglutarate dehydrogenase complex dihydrolipoamide acyltransferase (E2) component